MSYIRRRTGNPSTGYVRDAFNRPVSTELMRQHYDIGPVLTNYEVHSALTHSYTSDQDYVQAVIRAYIQTKRGRGRMNHEIGLKLSALERELPQFLPAFVAVRQQEDLPQSPWARTRMHRRSTQSATPHVTPLVRVTTAPARQQSTDAHLPADFRVRREQTEDDAPPPPYTRRDPEPEQTRLLEERLAAEQLARLPPDTPTPAPGPRTPAPRTPPARTPPAPAPGRPLSTRITPPGSPPTRRDSEELRIAMEESQLEEAKRASLLADQAERERKEMEEALILSLQSEASGSGNASGSGSGAGAGATGIPSRPVPPLMDADEGNWGSTPLVPQKTGAVMQSRNPFLAPHESPPLRKLPRPPK